MIFIYFLSFGMLGYYVRRLSEDGIKKNIVYVIRIALNFGGPLFYSYFLSVYKIVIIYTVQLALFVLINLTKKV